MTKTFADIDFGYASARSERDEAPSLLINGCIDFGGMFEKVENGSTFLFLGYKGSGKSFIGERFSLLSESRSDWFVNLVDLSDFPFTSFSKIIRGNSEPESKYPDAWAWILLTYLLGSFGKDGSIAHPHLEQLRSAISILSNAGFLPNTDLKKMIRDSSRKTFKLVVSETFEETSDIPSDSTIAEIPNFVAHVKEIMKEVKSSNKHYIIIDGLDDILTERSIQYKSLGSLMYEVSRLNSSFQRSGVPAKFIVLCRTDLYAKISGSNKNKVRQDLSVELDWYHDTVNLHETALVQAANLRCAISIPSVSDVFKKYFPSEIDSKETIHFLLEHTRHTPRDFLQLLKYIQPFYNGGILSRQQILSGARQYSLKYFRTEIIDELDGYFSHKCIERVFELFDHLQKREFRFDELVALVGNDRELTIEVLKEVLQAMFECSAIGNVQHRPAGTTFFSFKFRNRNSTLHFQSTIVLHRGLWKSLNLI